MKGNPYNNILRHLKDGIHKDGGFRDVSIEIIKKEYDEDANTVKAFLEDKCVADLTAPEYYALTTNVYNEYLIFCKERN
jgi:hypothetical protein